ncbi:MAG: PstS family phosphate ABC transporter substrate-binding protein [Deltaproteobacteria bacterium]|nr:PstS family phosphate ABC transporter substrate-binding protein [Deltaproteobacteria bacterium]
MRIRDIYAPFLLAVLVLPAWKTNVDAAVPENLSGTIKVDGSSTVYPITEAVAEEFGKIHGDVRVTVGISGTGGGFKKFCTGETDISDASRPIKPSEIETCSANKVDFIELPVAYDAISIVVNPKNTWVKSLTVADLKKMWEPEAQGKITKWNQIRSEWPNQPLRLFGPGIDSGTYDYFTEAIMGKEDASRGDYTSSEDDNTIVQGVANDVNALGFFGLAYYEENKGKLKMVPVDDGKGDNGAGPQMANAENVIEGIYQPLSRPLFVYVRKQAAERPEIKEFVQFYLKNTNTLSPEVGYVQLPDKVTELATNRFAERVTGSVYSGGHSQLATLEELYTKGS